MVQMSATKEDISNPAIPISVWNKHLYICKSMINMVLTVFTDKVFYTCN